MNDANSITGQNFNLTVIRTIVTQHLMRIGCISLCLSNSSNGVFVCV